MIKLFTGQPVAPATNREPDEPPRNFVEDRWSFIDELHHPHPPDRPPGSMTPLDSLTELSRLFEVNDTRLVRIEEAKLFRSAREPAPILGPALQWSSDRSRNLLRASAARRPMSGVWPAACRWCSTSIATPTRNPDRRRPRAGPLANPGGLPYTQDALVTTVLQNLSNNALTSTMNTSPTFAQYRSEIRANRPLVSFIPGRLPRRRQLCPDDVAAVPGRQLPGSAGL